MDDLVGMRVGQAARHVDADPQRLRHGERPVLQPLLERLPLEELEHQEGQSPPLAEVVEFSAKATLSSTVRCGNSA